MDYAALRQRAFERVRATGARVTFTLVTTSVDKTTGATTESSTTVSGYALSTPGVRRMYETLKLVSDAAHTLLFAPDPGVAMPSLGMTVPWGGATFTVRHVTEISPGGTLLLGRVIVA